MNEKKRKRTGEERVFMLEEGVGRPKKIVA